MRLSETKHMIQTPLVLGNACSFLGSTTIHRCRNSRTPMTDFIGPNSSSRKQLMAPPDKFEPLPACLRDEERPDSIDVIRAPEFRSQSERRSEPARPVDNC